MSEHPDHPPVITRSALVGGWLVEVTAPPGVTDFGLLELDLLIREHPNTTVSVPIDIHLRAEVQ